MRQTITFTTRHINIIPIAAPPSPDPPSKLDNVPIAIITEVIINDLNQILKDNSKEFPTFLTFKCKT